MNLRRVSRALSVFALLRSIVLNSVFVVCLAVPSSILADGLDSKAIYESLREAGLDGRSVKVEDLALERDAFVLQFTSGTFSLLEPVAGRSPGAVFTGEATYTLSPDSRIERRHLAVLTKSDVAGSFSDQFSSAVLLFDDETEAEILAAGALETGSADPSAAKALKAALENADDLEVQPFLRLLRSRLNNEGLATAPFFALVEGSELQRSVIGVDAMGILDGEGACLMSAKGRYTSYWFSDALAGASTVERHQLVDAEHYQIDTRVLPNGALEGEVRVRLKVLVPELSVLPVDLFESLEVKNVSVDGMDLAADFVYGNGESGPGAVLLPEPLAQGSKVVVRIDYSGDGIVHEGGKNIYQVRGRTNWYPNVGAFVDRAAYDLRFRVPKGHTVISVGERVSESEQGNEVISVWKSRNELTVAGFNYGDFEILEQKEENTGVSIEVYATKGEPDFVTEINQSLQAATEGLSFRQQLEVAGDGYSGYVNTYSGPSSIGVSASSLAEMAMADGVNSIQVFTNLFGPLDSERLAITQQSSWAFGQAWPTLVYLPYLPGFSRLMQLELGMDGYAGFVDQVGIHEIAHQWWGHHVGWNSYRDQWISEGFAEFSTALLIELTQGAEAYDQFWEQRRLAVLVKPRDIELPAYAAGAITLGYRAASPRAPQAAQALIYSKGAFVLQMLRTLMRDQKTRSDDRFFAMLRDFADTFKGRNPSTEDFKAHLDKHMIPELNAGGNGKVDWFFDQWVYGVEVPRYSSDVKIEKLGKNKYRLVGTVTQSGVSDDFIAMVPTYVDFGKGEYGQFGRAPFKGEMTHNLDVTLELPKKPKAVLLNARHEVLAFD